MFVYTAHIDLEILCPWHIRLSNLYNLVEAYIKTCTCEFCQKKLVVLFNINARCVKETCVSFSILYYFIIYFFIKCINKFI